MKWYPVEQFLPGIGRGYVITRVLNSDCCQFIYMAMYSKNGWEFWDEECWDEDTKRKEGYKVTHWTYMPEFNDGGF